MRTFLLSFIICLCPFSMTAQEQTDRLDKAYHQSAFELFNTLAQGEKANVCFSPLSLQIALSMVQHGAANNTLLQIQKALGTEEFTVEQVGAYNQELISKLTARSPYDEEYFSGWGEGDPQIIYDSYYPKCELANSLWARPDVSLYSDFVQALSTYYDASMDHVAFDTWEGIGKINDWAAEHTHGLIPSIYHEPQSSALAVMLANALYFKGSWTYPFDKSLTEKGRFLLDDRQFVTVDMMSAHDKFPCAVTESFNTVTLYYGRAFEFSMTIFVPREGTALPALTLEDWVASQHPSYVHVNLEVPHFDVAGNYELNAVLKKLGVTDAFDDKADFSRMSERWLFISNVSQMSKIIVDEKGTEAAAITVIDMCDGMDMTPLEDYQDFHVDRPFYFTIQNSKANALLFIGRVTSLNAPVSLLENGIASINSQPSAFRCYDLQGRPVFRIPNKGFYIQNGRKILK